MGKKLVSAVVVGLAIFCFILCTSPVKSENGCDEDCSITELLLSLVISLDASLSLTSDPVTLTVETAIAAFLHIPLPVLQSITVGLSITTRDLLEAIDCILHLLLTPPEGCLLDAVLECIAVLLKVTVVQLQDLIPDGLCVLGL